MNYSEFLSEIRHHMERRYREACVSVRTVLKNNGQCLDGLLILQPDENISPTIYLNSYYTQYLNGLPLDDILEEITIVYENHRLPSRFDLSLFRDFDQIRNQISFRLIGRSANLELLSDIPFLPFLDLAIVFFFTLEHEIIGTSSVLIRNNHLELWNTDTEELFSLAKTNTRSLSGCEIIPMERLLFPDTTEDSFSPSAHTLFVLSSHTRTFGAACLLYEDVLASFSSLLQDDFYVLPSSIHEVLLIPLKKSPPAEALLEMVQDINRTEVSPEDVLSNHLYLYHAREHRLGIVLFTGHYQKETPPLSQTTR
ncbi:MAG: hypothetical protein HFI63_03115 [Lachnospiraceae bacterium]|nr:hypothetical protein [Lachnospiraceae bacterium]